jgi:hypothetical protein
MKNPRKLELGAEPRKVVILSVLLVLAGYLVYTNLLSSGEDYVPPPKAAVQAPRPVRKAFDNVAQAEKQAGLSREEDTPAIGANKVIPGRRAQGDFRPVLKPRSGDPSKLDPALRLDLLAKLQKVELAGGGRSLFDFSTAPPAAAKPKQPEPKIAVKPPPKVQGPQLPPPPPPPPVKPPPPPIPLKFYGSALPVRGGARRVFCMQNDEIFTPTEGDVIMKRYRIVRINATGVVVEDIEHKNEQTLPIDEVPKSG